MQTLDYFAFLNGTCSGFYFLTCLACGLQLCFGIFHPNKSSNVLLLRSVGILMLLASLSSFFYILSAIAPSLSDLWIVGNTVDYLLFIGIAGVGHLLVANNKISYRALIVLSIPFVTLAVLNISLPSARKILPDIAFAILIICYIFYAIALFRREKSLEDLYSNPEQHSLKWIGFIVIMLSGWWITLNVFYYTDFLSAWCDVALYLYMTAVALFSFGKVSGYGEPVSLQTQNEVNKVKWCEVPTRQDKSGALQAGLLRLLKEEKIFLKADLIVDEVVRLLGSNTKYFSAMLHNDMGTTFCHLINEYRIEEAKRLLQSSDDKAEAVGMLCGFNSRQSFYRTFARFTGQSPAEWRKKNHI